MIRIAPPTPIDARPSERDRRSSRRSWAGPRRRREPLRPALAGRGGRRPARRTCHEDDPGGRNGGETYCSSPSSLTAPNSVKSCAGGDVDGGLDRLFGVAETLDGTSISPPHAGHFVCRPACRSLAESLLPHAEHATLIAIGRTPSIVDSGDVHDRI
jgi:hypothetical protein